MSKRYVIPYGNNDPPDNGNNNNGTAPPVGDCEYPDVLAVIRTVGREFAEWTDAEVCEFIRLGIPWAARQAARRLTTQAIAFMAMHLMKLTENIEDEALYGNAISSISEDGGSESYAMPPQPSVTDPLAALKSTEYGKLFLSSVRQPLLIV